MGLSKSRPQIPKDGVDLFGYRDIAEEHHHVPVNVSGCLPTWLRGSLYRQAGGAFIAGGSSRSRFLDGLAHFVVWHLADGEAHFSNGFLDSAQYRHWKKTGERLWGGTATAPGHELNRDGAVTASNLNVNFWRLDVGIAAASESPGGPVVLLDEQVKSVRELLAASDNIRHQQGMNFIAAHYLMGEGNDLHAGIFITMHWTSWLKPPTFSAGYRVFRSQGHRLPLEVIAELPMTNFAFGAASTQTPEQRVSYVHTTAETEHYLIIVAASKRLRYDKFLAKDFSRGFFGMFQYEADVPVTFYVFEKQGRFLKEVKAERAGMCYHLANAYEEHPGRVVLDLTWASGDVFGGASIQEAGMRRYVLDLALARATEHPVGLHVKEFPCVNPAVIWRKHRFLYGLGASNGTLGIWKEDLELGTATAWPHEVGRGSEPQFVQRPGAIEEDDGVLLIPTADPATGNSFLLVLDARSMTELARVFSPIDVNAGLHNLFVPASPLPRARL